MRERKKAGSGWGPRAMPLGRSLTNPRDTPKPTAKLRAEMISATVVVKSVAGALWRAVRRSPGASPPAADSSRFLTIGALTVVTPEPPSVPGVPTSRRQLTYHSLLEIATDLITARFILTRALDRLETEELGQVLDEVDETIQRNLRPSLWRTTTQRHDDE